MAFYSFDELKNIIEYTNDMFSNLCKVVKKLSHNNTLNFNDWEVMTYSPKTDNNLNYIQRQHQCACNHIILINCEIKNNFNGNRFIVGSSCVDHFGENAIKKRNELKKVYEGKKRCDYIDCEYSNAISIKVIKNILNENKEQTKFYHCDCMKIIFKKCRKCKKYKNYNCSCPPAYEPARSDASYGMTSEPLPVIPVIPIVSTPIVPVIIGETIITFNLGDYKGKTFNDVLNKNGAPWCYSWVLKTEFKEGQGKELQEYLKTIII